MKTDEVYSSERLHLYKNRLMPPEEWHPRLSSVLSHICTLTITTWVRDTPKNNRERTQHPLVFPGHTTLPPLWRLSTPNLSEQSHLGILIKVHHAGMIGYIISYVIKSVLALLTLEVKVPMLSSCLVPWKPALHSQWLSKLYLCNVHCGVTEEGWLCSRADWYCFHLNLLELTQDLRISGQKQGMKSKTTIS